MLIGRLFALLAAVASSCTPVFARHLHDAGWSSWQVVGARSTVGFLVVAAFLRGDLRRAAGDRSGAAGAALAMVLGNASFLYALTHASASTAVCVKYLSVFWTTLYQRWSGGSERFDVPASAMLVTGVACAVGFGGAEDTWPGVLCAGLAGIFNATFVLLGARVTRRVPPAVIACVGLGAGSLAFGWTLAFAPWHPAEVSVLAAGVGLVSGAGMFMATFFAFSHIGTETRMWLPLEILIIAAVQSVSDGHPPPLVRTVGYAAIIFATALLAWGKRPPTAAPSLPPS